LPSQFLQDTISGRIRFLGARVWIFLPRYLCIFTISRPASGKIIKISMTRWRR